MLDLLFPARCLSCRRPGSFLCADCCRKVRALSDVVCPTCHYPVDPAVPVCRCRAPLPALVVAAGEYEGSLRQAIQRFKYQGQSAGAPSLAALLAPRVRSVLRPGQLLVPVPLHPRRERQRGYNQSALLAQAVGHAVQAPVAERALRRNRATPPQVGRKAHERQQNMSGAFDGDPAYCDQRDILLIDDVYTTGATLHWAADAARKAGARAIFAAVLAVAPLGRDA